MSGARQQIRQQINLYQPKVEEQARGPFSSDTALAIAGVVCVCLLSVWVYAWWRVERLEHAMGALRRQQQQQVQTMASLGEARGKGISAAEMDERVKLLAAQVAVHSGALDMLRSEAIGQVGGFSGRLAALARGSVDGVSIDHIVLSGLSDAMSVGGTALSPELVPRYLGALGAEQELRGVRFGALAIERLDSHVNFRAESGAAQLGGGKSS